MFRTFVVLGCVTVLAGCAQVTDKLNEPGPSAGAVQRRETLINRDEIKVRTCELKNPAGTGDCDDGRRPSAPTSRAAERPVAENQPSNARAKFNPSMCRSIAQGGTGFFAFYGTLLTGTLGELGDYCRELERQNAAREPQRPAPSGGSGSRQGTWWCDDRADGSGNYGTWEMTQMTDRYYNCKRVN